VPVLFHRSAFGATRGGWLLALVLVVGVVFFARLALRHRSRGAAAIATFLAVPALAFLVAGTAMATGGRERFTARLESAVATTTTCGLDANQDAQLCEISQLVFVVDGERYEIPLDAEVVQRADEGRCYEVEFLADRAPMTWIYLDHGSRGATLVQFPTDIAEVADDRCR
jgi:hypothetical protein